MNVRIIDRHKNWNILLFKEGMERNQRKETDFEHWFLSI